MQLLEFGRRTHLVNPSPPHPSPLVDSGPWQSRGSQLPLYSLGPRWDWGSVGPRAKLRSLEPQRRPLVGQWRNLGWPQRPKLASLVRPVSPRWRGRGWGRDSQVERRSCPALVVELPQFQGRPRPETPSCARKASKKDKKREGVAGEKPQGRTDRDSAQRPRARPRWPLLALAAAGGWSCLGCGRRLLPAGAGGRAGGVGDSPGADICRLPS